MASKAYTEWLKAGKPYTLIRPAKALQAKVRVYGIVVYDYPNADHLQATVPQDHTPFSATGWPASNARWNARALDIMPRSDSAVHRKENADIARQIIKDKNAGHPGVAWIKYLNWTDENGVCRQVSWKPNYAVTISTDDDHIHISGRSDMDADTRADNYDPVARMLGVAMPTAAEQAALNADNALYHALQGESPIVGNKSVTSGQAVTFPNILAEMKTDIDTLVARPAAGNITLTPEQFGQLLSTIEQALGTLFMEKGGEVMEVAVTNVLSRTKLQVVPEAPAPGQE